MRVPRIAQHLNRIAFRTVVSDRFYSLRFLFVALLICIGLVILITPQKRTFNIESSSYGGQIEFSGHSNSWLIESASVCRLRDVPNFKSVETASGQVCDERLYEVTSLIDTPIRWQSGTIVSWKVRQDRSLQFSFQTSTMDDYPSGTLVIIGASSWSQHGLLPFQGFVRIGTPVTSGSDDYLLDGKWEALQSGFANSLFRSTTETVKTGNFTRGAIVEIHTEEAPVLAYGFLTPHGTNGSLGLNLLTEQADSYLQVSFFGVASPAIFKPDWIDSVSSSPLLLAAAAILSTLIGILEIFRKAIPQRVEPNEPKQKTDTNLK